MVTARCPPKVTGVIEVTAARVVRVATVTALKVSGLALKKLERWMRMVLPEILGRVIQRQVKLLPVKLWPLSIEVAQATCGVPEAWARALCSGATRPAIITMPRKIPK